MSCAHPPFLIDNCIHTEDSHVKTNFVHTLFSIQKYGLMSLNNIKTY